MRIMATTYTALCACTAMCLVPRVTYDQGVIVAEQNFPGTDSGVKLFCNSCVSIRTSREDLFAWTGAS